MERRSLGAPEKDEIIELDELNDLPAGRAKNVRVSFLNKNFLLGCIYCLLMGIFE
jgi:hypothetical protein